MSEFQWVVMLPDGSKCEYENFEGAKRCLPKGGKLIREKVMVNPHAQTTKSFYDALDSYLKEQEGEKPSDALLQLMLAYQNLKASQPNVQPLVNPFTQEVRNQLITFCEYMDDILFDPNPKLEAFTFSIAVIAKYEKLRTLMAKEAQWELKKEIVRICPEIAEDMGIDKEMMRDSYNPKGYESLNFTWTSTSRMSCDTPNEANIGKDEVPHAEIQEVSKEDILAVRKFGEENEDLSFGKENDEEKETKGEAESS